ncbi:MAG: putative Ig domain-containing protein [Comamonas sp.]|uniref:putative Ig domain-containing protein n=1 Tax=Comamonas sp. TaxID=34028 RepID=UPI002FCB39FE
MPIQITTSELPVGYVGKAYRAVLAATVSPEGSAVVWEARNALPPYLVLDPTTGVISGQSQREFRSSIAFWAKNTTTGETDNAVLLLNITQLKRLEILNRSLPDATEKQAYVVKLEANGGIAPYKWKAERLPTGLTCTSEQITGTPTQAGDFQVELTVTDSSTPASSTSLALPLKVNAALAPLDILTKSLQPGMQGQTYAQGLSANGGIAPYTWTASDLPSGLQIQKDVIGGIPTRAGSFQVTLKVADSASPASSTSLTLPLVVSSTPTTLVIVTKNLATAKTNTPYYQLLEASGGIEPYSWSSDGLPIGLQIDGDSIIGQPSVSGGAVPLTITVIDSKGTTASQFLLLDVQEG